MGIFSFPGHRFSLITGLWALIAFAVMVIAPRSASFLPALGGLIAAIAYYAGDKKFLKPARGDFIATALLLGLILISALWAIAPEDCFERAGKLAITILPALFFLAAVRSVNDPQSLAWIGRFLVMLYLLAVGLFCIELSFGLPLTQMFVEISEAQVENPFRLNRGLCILALTFFALPDLVQYMDAHRIRKTIWMAVAGIVLVYTLFISESQTALLAFFTGLAAYMLPSSKKGLYHLLAAIIISLMLIAPYMMGALEALAQNYLANSGWVKSASILHRFEVWTFVADKIQERPFFGYGIEAVRHLHADEVMPLMNSDNVLHPHNATLQIWVEFGIFGIALALLGLIYVLYAIAGIEDKFVRRSALAVFLAILCMANTGYGLWQGWQVGFFLYLSSLVLLAKKAK